MSTIHTQSKNCISCDFFYGEEEEEGGCLSVAHHMDVLDKRMRRGGAWVCSRVGVGALPAALTAEKKHLEAFMSALTQRTELQSQQLHHSQKHHQPPNPPTAAQNTHTHTHTHTQY